jgi:hypothetical protein
MKLRDRKRKRKERIKRQRAQGQHTTRFLQRAKADAKKAFLNRTLKPADMLDACLRDFVPPLSYAYVWVVYQLVFRHTWLDIRAGRDMLVRVGRKR